MRETGALALVCFLTICLGILLGVLLTDWLNRWFARRYGWCPECGRDTGGDS